MQSIASRLFLALAAVALVAAPASPALRAADEAMPARGAAGESMKPRPGADEEMTPAPGASVRPRPATGTRTAPAAGTAKAGAAGAAATAKASAVKWHTNWVPAAAEARKGDKMIMMYFSGSDWDDFSKKLHREVLSTPMFLEWAQKNVVLFQVDFSTEKKVVGAQKAQNDRMKQKYNVTQVPTIVFMDADGEPYVRAGYDTAKLRDDEKKGAPLKWIAFADNVVKSKPGQEVLRVQKGFVEASEYSRKTGLPFLLLITKAKDDPKVVEANKAIINSQKFIRFVNRTMIFMPWDWPDDTDTSPSAKSFREFAATYSIGDAPAQFVMFFPGRKKVTLKITNFSPSKIEALRKQLENELPKFDYGGAWLDDFHVAQAIASQMKRELLVAFTSMDGSDWCQKIDSEIWRHPEFREYSGKHLVLCRVDFPKAAPLPPDAAERNRRLAEVYGVRGYPTMVLLNADGQRIGNAKYQKGGPRPFLTEVDELRRRDYERKTLASDQVEVVD